MKIARIIDDKRYLLLTVLTLVGFTLYLFYPMLFLQQSLVHADNLHHGYAFLKFHHDVVFNGVSPFWTDLIYGGHPLFAESQAGLSNPINYLIVWLFSPVFGQNLIHMLATIALGAGTFGLCRTVGISGAGAMFAALASTFSSLFIQAHSNMIAIEAMIWIPCTMWAFEAWLNKPDMKRAIVFGLVTSMLVFSGYPHFLHGVVIYLTIRAVTALFDRQRADSWLHAIGQYWLSGLIAIVVCVGISSVQWLPLLELSNYSHRQDGVGLQLHAAPDFIFRGFIFPPMNTPDGEQDFSLYFPNIGSLLVCVLASASIFQRPQAKILGHILAVFLLINLGLGTGSPLYNLIVAHSLIPGIDKFRILFPYFYPAIIGIALLAGNSIDALADITGKSPNRLSRGAILQLAVTTIIWSALVALLWTADTPTTGYYFTAAGIAITAICFWRGKAQWLGPALIILLIIEIMSLRANTFNGVDEKLLLTPPPSVEYIKSTKDYRDYKHFQIGFVPLSFSSPFGNFLEQRTIHEMRQIVSSTNLLWGIPSFSGALALQMQSRPEVVNIIIEEIRGAYDHRAGLRFMDIHSIKWVSDRPGTASQTLEKVKWPAVGGTIMENPHAYPKAQIYHHGQNVSGPEEALQLLLSSDSRVLAIEAENGELPAGSLSLEPSEVHLTRESASSTLQHYKSRSNSAFWLFLSENHYAGWVTTIDGIEVRDYSAQVLGKAVFIPAGSHDIAFRYVPQSLYIGALISMSTIAALLCAGIIYWIRRTRRPISSV